MKPISRSIFSLILIFTAIKTANVQASEFYAGADYFWSNIKIDGNKTHPTMTNLKFGASVWNNITLEAQYGVPTNNGSIYRLDFELEEAQAVYLRFLTEDSAYWYLDISLGYASTTLKTTGPEDTYNGTETYKGFSWGLFAVKEIEFLPNTHFKIGYQSLFNDNSLKIEGLSTGISYHF